MVDDIRTVWQRNLFQAFAQHNLDDASQILDRLRDHDPLSRQTRGLELEFLWRSERLDEAHRLARQLLELFPDSPRILYLAGRLAYARREYPRAEQLLAESYRLHPNRYCYRFLGKTYTQLARYDEAESILLAVLPDDPGVQLDLAWLYERQADYERALAHVEKFLEKHPENEYARAQQGRLRGRTMDPGELLGDLDSLVEHDQPIPEHLLPQYVENLLRTGQGERVRHFLSSQRDRFEPREAIRTAWFCYQLQAHDLAYELFVRVFEQNRRQPKFLSALEASASRCGRLEELIPIYEKWAVEDPRFFGRLRGLKRRVQ